MRPSRRCFKPVRPPTTFEETVERLGTAIRLGLLVPGSKLPPERELAEELRISRSTLRQALTTLVQSGHLTAVRGRSGGTFVADRPPLAERDEDPLDGNAVGRARPAGRDRGRLGDARRRARRGARPGRPRRSWSSVMAVAAGFEALPARRHPLPHRARGRRPLPAPGHRDDRGPGADERPDRADRPPRGGADPLQRPARASWSPTCAPATPPPPPRPSAPTSAAPSTSSPG